MPHTKTLPHNWYDTPNIHFCTIRDFVDLCDELEIVIENSFSLDSMGRENTCEMDISVQTLWASRVFFSSAGAI